MLYAENALAQTYVLSRVRLAVRITVVSIPLCYCPNAPDSTRRRMSPYGSEQLFSGQSSAVVDHLMSDPFGQTNGTQFYCEMA